jgi:hypothetical protein
MVLNFAIANSQGRKGIDGRTYFDGSWFRHPHFDLAAFVHEPNTTSGSERRVDNVAICQHCSSHKSLPEVLAGHESTKTTSAREDQSAGFAECST